MSEAKLLLAFDLGTTTLAGRLLAPDGAVLAEAEARNPQAEFGADVIRRLEAALGGRELLLQASLVEGLEVLISELLAQAGRSRSAIIAAAAAGNPAISYLLRRLPAQEILFPPHRPQETAGAFLAPVALGLDLPVPLYLFPLVSGYVGGDLVAFLLAAEPWRTRHPLSGHRYQRRDGPARRRGVGGRPRWPPARLSRGVRSLAA